MPYLVLDLKQIIITNVDNKNLLRPVATCSLNPLIVSTLILLRQFCNCVIVLCIAEDINDPLYLNPLLNPLEKDGPLKMLYLKENNKVTLLTDTSCYFQDIPVNNIKSEVIFVDEDSSFCEKANKAGFSNCYTYRQLPSLSSRLIEINTQHPLINKSSDNKTDILPEKVKPTSKVAVVTELVEEKPLMVIDSQYISNRELVTGNFSQEREWLTFKNLIEATHISFNTRPPGVGLNAMSQPIDTDYVIYQNNVKGFLTIEHLGLNAADYIKIRYTNYLDEVMRGFSRLLNILVTFVITLNKEKKKEPSFFQSWAILICYNVVEFVDIYYKIDEKADRKKFVGKLLYNLLDNPQIMLCINNAEALLNGQQCFGYQNQKQINGLLAQCKTQISSLLAPVNGLSASLYAGGNRPQPIVTQPPTPQFKEIEAPEPPQLNVEQHAIYIEAITKIDEIKKLFTDENKLTVANLNLNVSQLNNIFLTKIFSEKNTLENKFQHIIPNIKEYLCGDLKPEPFEKQAKHFVAAGKETLLRSIVLYIHVVFYSTYKITEILFWDPLISSTDAPINRHQKDKLWSEFCKVRSTPLQITDSPTSHNRNL